MRAPPAARPAPAAPGGPGPAATAPELPDSGALLGQWGGARSNPAAGVLGSVWFLRNRYTPYPNLYPDQSPSEDWTMEERFRPLTFHGLILRSQLVTLLVRGVCYSESQSVSLSALCRDLGRHKGGGSTAPVPRGVPRASTRGARCRRLAVLWHVQPHRPLLCSVPPGGLYRGGHPQSPSP